MAARIYSTMTEKKVFGELWNQSIKYPHDVKVEIMSEKMSRGFNKKFGPFKANISELRFKTIILDRIRRRLGEFQVTVAMSVQSVRSDSDWTCRLILH